METRLVQCATCGAEIDLVTGECPYCPPASTAAEAVPPAAAAPAVAPVAPAAPVAPVVAPAAAPAALPTSAPPPSEAPPERDRALGLLLFEAEESLARGSPEKALILASKAVKDRPESLTARALLDRARREMLRGKRRGRLEARVQEARGFIERGEFEGAERIVTSALKLIPDHPVALELFGKIKEHRLGAPTAEAEAERELARIAGEQARKSLEAARAAFGAGWERRALFAVLQGLRHVPDHPELLALLREVQKSMDRLDLERSRRRALHAQVRAGLDLLAQGQIDESLRILRAVLHEDPDNARAQAAVQQVRQVWLTRQEFVSAVAPAHPSPQMIVPPQPAAAAPPVPVASAPAAPVARPGVGEARPPLAAAPRPAPALRSGPVDRNHIPVEIRLPATRRRATPIGLVLACAAAILVAIGFVVLGRGARPTPAASAGPRAPLRSTAPPPPAPVDASGPLAGIDADLRRAIESTLAAYARALEAGAADRLTEARPDLAPQERERVLAPFRGALNAATDLRVLSVDVRGDEADVAILRSDVIVGPNVPQTSPVEEVLRFRRQPSGWRLK